MIIDTEKVTCNGSDQLFIVYNLRNNNIWNFVCHSVSFSIEICPTQPSFIGFTNSCRTDGYLQSILHLELNSFVFEMIVDFVEMS